MRILHTEWSDGLGGQEKRVLAEARGLAERGHSVRIACRDHCRIKDEASKIGISVHVFPMRKSFDIGSMISMAGLMRNMKPDIVNTHSGVDAWLGGIAARLAGVPVLVRTRHLNIPLKRSPLNFIHYLPDIYITCGENMKNNLVRNCGFPENGVVSIPTGVGSSFFQVKKNNEGRAKYGIDVNTPVVTNVGILRSVKGHEVTFRAVKAVVDAVPGVKFLIVGDGPRREALEKAAGDLGISEHVIFTGFVEDIPEVYSFSDVAVLSSWSEGLPQSLLQAMAAGVPAVATRVGGVPEVALHEKTGLLVEPGDHDALAQGIIRLLSDHDFAAEVAGRARDKVKGEHSIDHMIDQTENLYSEILSRKGRR